MKLKMTKTLTAVFLFAIPALGFGQIAPDLKSAADFAILAGTEITFADPMSTINDMDIGLYPGNLSSITGYPAYLTLNNGVILAADQDPQIRLPQAKQDLLDAYNYAAGAVAPVPAIIAGDQGGTTLYPGIYKSTSTLLIQSGDLTLDAQGDVNAVWIFQITDALTTIGGSPFPSPTGGNVILTGGAMANNVFWQVGSSATIGDYTSFKGNILALQSISMNSGSSIDGRVLALNAAVTFAGGGTMNQPAETPVVSENDILITKTAGQETFSEEGEEIEYEIVVENVGVGTLNEIAVEDDLTGDTWLINLAPGAFETLTTSYIITEADILNGSVENEATAEIAGVIVSDMAVVAFTPPIPFSTWALVLGGVLIAGFVFFQFRRSTRLKSV